MKIIIFTSPIVFISMIAVSSFIGTCLFHLSKKIVEYVKK